MCSGPGLPPAAHAIGCDESIVAVACAFSRAACIGLLAGACMLCFLMRMLPFLLIIQAASLLLWLGFVLSGVIQVFDVLLALIFLLCCMA